MVPPVRRAGVIVTLPVAQGVGVGLAVRGGDAVRALDAFDLTPVSTVTEQAESRTARRSTAPAFMSVSGTCAADPGFRLRPVK
jgi:hypothetical protein